MTEKSKIGLDDSMFLVVGADDNPYPGNYLYSFLLLQRASTCESKSTYLIELLRMHQKLKNLRKSTKPLLSQGLHYLNAIRNYSIELYN